MVDFIRNLIKKNQRIISYLFFGVLTTIVSFTVYYFFLYLLDFSATFSQVISWICAVIFAFLTNKPFVFESQDWTVKVVAPEFLKFIGGRLGSGVFETLFIFVTVDLISWDGMLMKALVSIIVIILNYLVSNYFVFKKK